MKSSFLPDISEMFEFKKETTIHLDRLSEAVMRGPSPLSPGFRELIAAFVSSQNECRY